MPNLFPQKAHTLFMDLTRSRYAGMQKRMEKKKLPPLSFSLDEFRAHFVAALGGSSNGAARCRYCNRMVAPDGCAADHMIPLSRGGGMGLDNIDFPCAACNAVKGEMTPVEFKSFLMFMDTMSPFVRRDVLKRLQMSVKLAAGSRRNAARINELKKSGQWHTPKAKEADPQGMLSDF
jgi:hypothetical protein